MPAVAAGDLVVACAEEEPRPSVAAAAADRLVVCRNAL